MVPFGRRCVEFGRDDFDRVTSMLNLERLGQKMKRRTFLAGGAHFLGPVALASLSGQHSAASPVPRQSIAGVAAAKRVIYLFMSGGPSHVDTFDHKPAMAEFDGQPIPPSVVEDVHFAMIPSNAPPLVKASPYRFTRSGECGTWVSELLPHIGRIADDLCVVKSLHSDIFNHDPAVSLLNTGDPRIGRPTMGAWMSYGLGTENNNLPAYIVLTSGIKLQPLLNSYWSNGFLSSRHQGVLFRSSGDPVMFLKNPSETGVESRRAQIDLIKWLNARRLELVNDPEIATRIEQYELAFRMQSEVPELIDLQGETAETLALYGAQPDQPSFSMNCLLARRMIEQGVRFVQLYDMGWDSHGSLQKDLPRQCQAIDQGVAGLLTDLKRRGLLEDTLVLWGGEFGRTPVAQGEGEKWGRDHHPHGFTMWMAGGGVRTGMSYGGTDDFGFHAAVEQLDVHDLHATVLHCLGIDHRSLVFRHQGRDFRLTDVSGRVIEELVL